MTNEGLGFVTRIIHRFLLRCQSFDVQCITSPLPPRSIYNPVTIPLLPWIAFRGGGTYYSSHLPNFARQVKKKEKEKKKRIDKIE